MRGKEKVIDIDAHAHIRLMQRAIQFGLSCEDAKERAFRTVKLGNETPWKHRSERGKTYSCYFQDGLSFYVLCREREYPEYKYILIKTIIIEDFE